MYRFFSDPATGKAIDRLAKCDQLSIFVGAGASKEVGILSWSDLVSQLGTHVVSKSLSKTPNSLETVVRFIQSSGVLAAAERVAASLTASQLRQHIFDALYRDDDPRTLWPGPLVRAVAHVKAHDLKRCRVITTNYDQLLVQALRDAGATNAKSYCTDTKVDEAVIHLHGVVGFVNPADGDNEIVLTESDFLAPKSGGWRRDVVTKALLGGPCLFVGVSLTDLNLLGPLHNSQQKHKHVVVFARDDRLTPAVLKDIEKIEKARWKKLNVDCLFADNYVDSSVFVREVGRQRLSRGDGMIDRLDAWHASVVSPYIPSDLGGYERVQQTLSSTLYQLLGAIQGAHDLQNEVMQLGLFTLGLDSAVEFAHMLATSDRVMKDPRSSERLDLRRGTNWTGVKAMCSAVPISEPKDNYASRWKQMLAVPICLDDLSGACVGAVVLSSTSGSSRLNKIGATGLLTAEYDLLYSALHDAGTQLLSRT